MMIGRDPLERKRSRSQRSSEILTTGFDHERDDGEGLSSREAILNAMAIRDNRDGDL
jgi:hypothetical protein